MSIYQDIYLSLIVWSLVDCLIDSWQRVGQLAIMDQERDFFSKDLDDWWEIKKEKKFKLRVYVCFVLYNIYWDKTFARV